MKSNEALLTIRQNLISWFKKYEYIAIPVIRFVLTLSVLNMLKKATEYDGAFAHILVLLGVSIIGAFASAESIVVCALMVTTIFIAGFNLILGIIVFLFMAMLYILYGRIYPKESLLVIATLVAFSLNIEIAIPIVVGLFGSYMSVIAIMIGTIIWYTLPVLIRALPAISFNQSEILDTVKQLIEIDYRGMLVNKEMLVMCVIIFIVFMTVYVIRKLDVDYGPYIGIFTGAIMNILGFLLAKIFFQELKIELFNVIVVSIIAALVAIIMQFLSVVLDYQRAEIVNFEDDDNYYYVKIIPKIQLAAKKQTIKHVYNDKAAVKNEVRSENQVLRTHSNDIKQTRQMQEEDKITETLRRQHITRYSKDEERTADYDMKTMQYSRIDMSTKIDNRQKINKILMEDDKINF